MKILHCTRDEYEVITNAEQIDLTARDDDKWAIVQISKDDKLVLNRTMCGLVISCD